MIVRMEKLLFCSRKAFLTLPFIPRAWNRALPACTVRMLWICKSERQVQTMSQSHGKMTETEEEGNSRSKEQSCVYTAQGAW
jgi:hypothetical protein